MKKRRAAGILLHISSLPSPYGIGTFGEESYRFVDFLKSSGQTYWQVLPLGPTGYGDSPYQVISSFAGNPYFIDLDYLAEDGLLDHEDLMQAEDSESEGIVDYSELFKERFSLLRKAYERIDLIDGAEFEEFKLENATWLEDYSLYMALKYKYDQKPYYEWPREVVKREVETLGELRQELSVELEYWSFLQYLFFSQWRNLKDYANKQGIKIIGDLPIYVGRDSADVWANPEVFCLDEDYSPRLLSGVPPDYFSPLGQLWGNPVYDWEYLEETDYSWWKSRISQSKHMFDGLRLDHFRGFESYWVVNSGNETAVEGSWVKGPGMQFFESLKEELQGLEIIAEDLGFLTHEVYKLKYDTGYMGMAILQFAFDGNKDNPYLPYNFESNSVVYPGTHDNDTVRGWLSKLDEQSLSKVKDYLNEQDDEKLVWEIIRAAYSSVSSLCIVQFQDILEQGSECRMNTPSSKSGNWSWRLKREDIKDEISEKLLELCRIYGR